MPTGMTIRNILCTDIINELLKVSDYEVICAVNNPIKYKDYLKHERLSFIDFYEKKVFSFSNLILMIL